MVMSPLSDDEDAADNRTLLENALNTSSRTVTVNECVNVGTTSFQRRALLPLALGNAADAVEILSVGYIMTVYRDSSGNALTSTEKEFLTAAVFMGMLVGGLGCGFFSDRVGRKPCLLLSLAVNALFGLLSAMAPSVRWLIGARIVAGLGVGGSVPTVFTLGAELFPTKRRGALLSLIASFWMIGSIFAATFAWILLGDTLDGTRIVPGATWRHYAVIAALPALLALATTAVMVPESPRFLMRSGKYSQAAVVLSQMTGTFIPPEKLHAPAYFSPPGLALPATMRGTVVNGGSSPYARIPSQVGVRSPGSDGLDGCRTAVVSLFQGDLRATTAVLMVVWYTLSYGSYGISTWNSELFADIGLSNAYLSSFIYALANLPGNVVSIVIVDKVGRKHLLAWSMVLAAGAATLFAVGTAGGAVVIVGAASLFNAFSVAGWNCLDCLSTESFPTPVRTSGMGIVSALGRAGSITAQFVNGSLEGNIPLLLLVTSGLMLVGGLFCLLLPYEPSGQSLEDENPGD